MGVSIIGGHTPCEQKNIHAQNFSRGEGVMAKILVTISTFLFCVNKLAGHMLGLACIVYQCVQSITSVFLLSLSGGGDGWLDGYG